MSNNDLLIEFEHCTSECSYICASAKLLYNNLNEPITLELEIMWSTLFTRQYYVPLKSVNDLLHRYMRKHGKFLNKKTANSFLLFRAHLYDIKKKYHEFKNFKQNEISKLSKMIWSNSKLRLQPYFKSFYEELKFAILTVKNECESLNVIRERIPLPYNNTYPFIQNLAQTADSFNNGPYLYNSFHENLTQT
ncbi:2136_t:CDS:2, partial [Ambispora leptoticha]